MKLKDPRWCWIVGHKWNTWREVERAELYWPGATNDRPYGALYIQVRECARCGMHNRNTQKIAV